MTTGQLRPPSFQTDGCIKTSRPTQSARDARGEFTVKEHISVKQRTQPMRRPITVATVPSDVADSGKIRLGGTVRLPSRTA